MEFDEIFCQTAAQPSNWANNNLKKSASSVFLRGNARLGHRLKGNCENFGITS